MPVYLTESHLRAALASIAKRLDELSIDYATMGSAATCVIGIDTLAATQDIELVIQVDERNITADQVTDLFLKSYKEFAAVSQVGQAILGYRIVTEGVESLIEIEIFDHLMWPNGSQYDLSVATRSEINLQGQNVKMFSPEWILRERVLSQHEREGSLNEEQDIRDAMQMLIIARPGVPEVDFDGRKDLEAALRSLLRKNPDARDLAKQKVKCKAVFT